MEKVMWDEKECETEEDKDKAIAIDKMLAKLDMLSDINKDVMRRYFGLDSDKESVSSLMITLSLPRKRIDAIIKESLEQLKSELS
jgi:DNA-directed RNA polymerase sigma subunit (sigma70/sigma32)